MALAGVLPRLTSPKGSQMGADSASQFVDFLTGATLAHRPSFLVHAGIDIRPTPGMPAQTMRFAVGPSHVHSSGHGLKVVRVHAALDATEVIDLQAGWNRADEILVRPAMCQYAADRWGSARAEDAVPIGTTITDPMPTSVVLGSHPPTKSVNGRHCAVISTTADRATLPLIRGRVSEERLPAVYAGFSRLGVSHVRRLLDGAVVRGAAVLIAPCAPRLVYAEMQA